MIAAVATALLASITLAAIPSLTDSALRWLDAFRSLPR